MAYVAIDAGHGINTPGKRTPDGEREWSFNNKVALACIAKLQANGVRILRTDDPTGNTDVPLTTRTDKANAAKVDLMVSIHHNANTAQWGTWTGTQVHVYKTKPAGSTKLATILAPLVANAYGLNNRGVIFNDLHITRETHMDAVLIEGGFMDSTIDIVKLRNDSILKKAGENIADGIMQYLGITPKAAPAPAPTPQPAPSNLFRVRKSWADAASQIGAFGELENAIFVAKSNPGYNVYDTNGKQVYPEVAPQPAPAQLYRVRKSWADAGSQIGAYAELDNAKVAADQNPGYTVFDSNGNAVYVGKVAETPQPAPTPAPEPQPEPTPVPVENHDGHHSIVGQSTVVAEQMIAFVKQVNPDFDEAIAPAYLSVGAKYGIRGDMAFCQSVIETGWFKFDGGTAVTPDQHNYCGMGVTSKGMKGNSFDTIEDGVTAQVQHLFAYATALPLPEERVLDPRFKYVTRGIAPHWEDLNNRWAMNSHYGQDIVALFEKLAATPIPVKEEPKPEPAPVPEAPKPEPQPEEPVKEAPTPVEKEKVNVGLLNKVLQAILDFFNNLFKKN